MSGGHFNYIQHQLDDAADEIQRMIESNDQVNEFGAAWNFSKETLEKFKEAQKQVRLSSEMIRRIDYLVCSDDSEETFKTRWEDSELTPSHT